MKLRRRIVERPFATIKAGMGHSHFPMERPKEVRTEINFDVLAYILKPATQISEQGR